MVFCTNCGSEITRGASFCGSCGTDQNQNANTCNGCGKNLEENEKFCSSCGTPVKADLKKDQPKPPKTEAPKYTKEGRKIISGGPKQKFPVNPPSKNITSPQKKKRGCMSKIFRFIGVLLILFVLLLVVLYFLPDSSLENDDLTDTNIPGIVDIEPGDLSHLPENRENSTGQTSPASFVEEKALKATTASVEKAFASADTIQLMELLTPQSQKKYSGKFKVIQPEMVNYAKALASKKLIVKTEIYALYSINDDNGNSITAEYAQVEPGVWKLVRF